MNHEEPIIIPENHKVSSYIEDAYHQTKRHHDEVSLPWRIVVGGRIRDEWGGLYDFVTDTAFISTIYEDPDFLPNYDEHVVDILAHEFQHSTQRRHMIGKLSDSQKEYIRELEAKANEIHEHVGRYSPFTERLFRERYEGENDRFITDQNIHLFAYASENDTEQVIDRLETLYDIAEDERTRFQQLSDDMSVEQRDDSQHHIDMRNEVTTVFLDAAEREGKLLMDGTDISSTELHQLCDLTTAAECAQFYALIESYAYFTDIIEEETMPDVDALSKRSEAIAENYQHGDAILEELGNQLTAFYRLHQVYDTAGIEVSAEEIVQKITNYGYQRMQKFGEERGIYNTQ